MRVGLPLFYQLLSFDELEDVEVELLVPDWFEADELVAEAGFATVKFCTPLPVTWPPMSLTNV